MINKLSMYFTRSLRSLVKYFSTLEEKFCISAQPCNILYLFENLFRDIMSIYNEPPPGMCIVPDKDDITKVCVSQCTIYPTSYIHVQHILLFLYSAHIYDV